MIDTSWRETRAGEIYAIGVGDRIMLRRLSRTPKDELQLVDDAGVLDPVAVQPGEHFMPTLQDEKTLYFGRVVWHGRTV